MSGAFAPGDRLDPARMTSEVSSSITPVREALYRLTGERIVESWQHEGFRVPLMTEAVLRDLYAWSLELVTIVIRSARRARAPAPGVKTRSSPRDLGGLLLDIAALSPNHEHRVAIVNLNERSQMLRIAEQSVVGDLADLRPLAAAIDSRAWSQAQTILTGHFRRRIRSVVGIAAALPSRQTT